MFDLALLVDGIEKDVKHFVRHDIVLRDVVYLNPGLMTVSRQGQIDGK